MVVTALWWCCKLIDRGNGLLHCYMLWQWQDSYQSYQLSVITNWAIPPPQRAVTDAGSIVGVSLHVYICLCMGRLCRFIVAWCTLREWLRMQNCDIDNTTTNYSLVVQWGMKLCFPVFGQAQWREEYRLVTVHTHVCTVTSTASLEYQATGTITCYPTQLHYPNTEWTSPCPILIMPSTRVGSDKYQF